MPQLEGVAAVLGPEGEFSPKEYGTQDLALIRVVMDLSDPEDGVGYSQRSQMCYHVLGIVHRTWAPIPGKMKAREEGGGSAVVEGLLKP